MGTESWKHTLHCTASAIYMLCACELGLTEFNRCIRRKKRLSKSELAPGLEVVGVDWFFSFFYLSSEQMSFLPYINHNRYLYDLHMFLHSYIFMYLCVVVISRKSLFLFVSISSSCAYTLCKLCMYEYLSVQMGSGWLEQERLSRSESHVLPWR